MNMKTLEDKAEIIIKECKAGLFFGMKEENGEHLSTCMVNGMPGNIVHTITTIVLRASNEEQSDFLRDVLFQSVLNIMVDSPKHASEFFAQLNMVTNEGIKESEEEQKQAKIITPKFK